MSEMPSAEELAVRLIDPDEPTQEDVDDVRQAFDRVLEAALASFSHTAGGSFAIVAVAISKLKEKP